MNKRKISIIYKLFTLFCLCFGVSLNLMLTSSVVSLISYYTLQSNIICIILFLCSCIFNIKNNDERSDLYYFIKGAATVAILTTSIIYYIALKQYGFSMIFKKNIGNILANLFVHTISPILVFLDYLFFDVKGKFKFYYPFLWLIIPADYVIYVYTYSLVGGRFYGIGGSRKFGYIFLDYQKIGIYGVWKSIIAITCLILVISYVIYAVDKIFSKKKEP